MRKCPDCNSFPTIERLVHGLMQFRVFCCSWMSHASADWRFAVKMWNIDVDLRGGL